MAWPYRFILSLSDEELERRRDILDSRGHYAQISGLILLGAFFLYGLGQGNRFEQNKGKSWWDAPAIRGGSETRKQYAVTLSWLLWLVSLSIWRTGDGEFSKVVSVQISHDRLMIHQRLHSLDKGFGSCWPISTTLLGVTGPYIFHLYFQLNPTISNLLLNLNSAASSDSLPPSLWSIRHCASCL